MVALPSRSAPPAVGSGDGDGELAEGAGREGREGDRYLVQGIAGLDVHPGEAVGVVAGNPLEGDGGGVA